MKSHGLTRSEAIGVGLLVLGAAAFGAQRLGQAMYKAREPQLFEEETQVVAPGETIELTYREIGQECNYIPWSGNVEMTLTRIELYESYTNASRVESNIGEPNSFLHDENDPFLLIEVEAKNVDAQEGEYAWHAVDIPLSEDSVALEQVAFELYSDTAFNDDGNYLSPAVWCVDGKASSEHVNIVELSQGETVYLTLGFTLEDGAENHLDGASLIYGMTFFDRMSIGSPAVGGETDETVQG